MRQQYRGTAQTGRALSLSLRQRVGRYRAGQPEMTAADTLVSGVRDSSGGQEYAQVAAGRVLRGWLGGADGTELPTCSARRIARAEDRARRACGDSGVTSCRASLAPALRVIQRATGTGTTRPTRLVKRLAARKRRRHHRNRRCIEQEEITGFRFPRQSDGERSLRQQDREGRAGAATAVSRPRVPRAGLP